MATQQTFAFLDTDSVRVAKPARRSTTARPRAAPTPSVPLPNTGDIDGSAVASPANQQPPSQQTPDRESVLRQLRKSIGCVTTALSDETQTFSTGSAAIDRWLPQGGLRTDALTEWVGADAHGAATLAMIAAATYLRSDSVTGPLVIVDGDGSFYPPAAVSLGVAAERIVLVRPRRHADVVWSIDQALRCESVAAIWAHVSQRLDDRDARRFQLAAEAGRTSGLLVRPSSVRGRPSFADVRFHVAAHDHQRIEKGVRSLLPERPSGCFAQKAPDPFFASPNRPLEVTLDRCRGGTVGQNVWLQIDDQARVNEVATEAVGILPSAPSHESTDHEQASTLRLASELAHPTSAKSVTERRA